MAGDRSPIVYVGTSTAVSSVTDQQLLFSLDENYALPGLVAIDTALTYSPETVHVTVASAGLSYETVSRLHRTVRSRDRDLSVVEVGGLVDSLPRGLPRFSPVAWARMFIEQIIPAETERIVYLDADTYCRKPIGQLFELDLGGLPLAAVPDSWEPTHELRGEDYWIAASTDRTAAYFNSGVMVIDRSSWVDRHVTSKALGLIAEGRVPTRSVDQDILNAVLWDEWVALPGMWNTLGSDTGTIDQARIVHFIGDRKPWNFGEGGGPFEAEYRRKAAYHAPIRRGGPPRS